MLILLKQRCPSCHPSLPQKDLDLLVQDAQRIRNIKLSHDLESVKTTVTIEDGTIVFYLEVPIIDDKKQFNLYTVSALPVFMNKKSCQCLFSLLGSENLQLKTDLGDLV